MVSNIHLGPSQALVKQKISEQAKKLAIVQILLVGALIAIIGTMKDILVELLNIPSEYLESQAALQEYLEQILEGHMEILSFMLILLLALFVLGIMYLFLFYRFSKNFTLLAQTNPLILKPAKNVSLYIRIAIAVQLGSLVLSLFALIPYLTEILLIVGFGSLVYAYYNISQMFKILRVNNLYPKKENRILFYSQIVPVLAMIPLSFSLFEFSAGQEFNLVTLIIGGVIILGGYIGIVVGFYKLSSDILLISSSHQTLEYTEQSSATP